jgi:hypothetical protein
MTSFPTQPRLRIVPLELRELNALVDELHRHHKPVQGHRFSLGVVDQTGAVRGGASIGRPVARMTNAKEVVEITRLVTDGCANACSCLYAGAARVAKAMGYKRIQTFILAEEPGTSLLAAGFTKDHTTSGGSWERLSKPNRRHDQPETPKHRWSKEVTQ